MPDLFKAFALPRHRAEIPLYRTPMPAVDEKLVNTLAKAFGVVGKTMDVGAQLAIRGRTGMLEVFEASGSVWWTKAPRAKSEPVKSIPFVDDRQAIALSDEYLKKIRLWESYAKAHSVTYSEVLFEKNGDREPAKAIVEQNVNYRFMLDDLPVWGPGAKIQVSFGEKNHVIEMLKFWREVRKDRAPLQVMKPEAALKIFRDHEMFADLSPQEASVQIDEMAIGFYALPPREVQGCLIPVYMFKGYVATRSMPKYSFTKYVVAVPLSPESAKKEGAVVTAGGPVI